MARQTNKFSSIYIHHVCVGLFDVHTCAYVVVCIMKYASLLSVPMKPIFVPEMLKLLLFINGGTTLCLKKYSP